MISVDISSTNIKIISIALLRKQMNNSLWLKRVCTLIYDFIIHEG